MRCLEGIGEESFGERLYAGFSKLLNIYQAKDPFRIYIWGPSRLTLFSIHVYGYCVSRISYMSLRVLSPFATHRGKREYEPSN